jgi:two-component system response regulator HupR/HoxA
VRELENEIERAATMANNSELILPEHLSDRIRATLNDNQLDNENLSLEKRGKLKKMVEEFEKKAIESALTHYKGNKTKAASELGLSRLGLRNKMIRYGSQDGKVSDYTNQAFK